MGFFSTKDLDKALNHKNILVSSYGDKNCSTGFKRHREVIINGTMYKISWFVVTCYLKTKDLTISFKYVKRVNGWLKGSKVNLQFYDESDKVCCVLRIR